MTKNQRMLGMRRCVHCNRSAHSRVAATIRIFSGSTAPSRGSHRTRTVVPGVARRNQIFLSRRPPSTCPLSHLTFHVVGIHEIRGGFWILFCLGYTDSVLPWLHSRAYMGYVVKLSPEWHAVISLSFSLSLSLTRLQSYCDVLARALVGVWCYCGMSYRSLSDNVYTTAAFCNALGLLSAH